jgi:endonuclease/exonuclease/phosphatase family metal-dependent hydrolase
MNNRIDYIWVTPNIKVEKYGVLNEMQYGRFPSDHFPVVIEAKF